MGKQVCEEESQVILAYFRSRKVERKDDKSFISSGIIHHPCVKVAQETYINMANKKKDPKLQNIPVAQKLFVSLLVNS